MNTRDDFPANCADVAKLPQPFLLIRSGVGMSAFQRPMTRKTNCCTAISAGRR